MAAPGVCLDQNVGVEHGIEQVGGEYVAGRTADHLLSTGQNQQLMSDSRQQVHVVQDYKHGAAPISQQFENAEQLLLVRKVQGGSGFVQ